MDNEIGARGSEPTQPPPPSTGSRQPSRQPTGFANLLRTIRNAAFVLLAVLLVRVLDPLGVDEVLTHRVEDIIIRVLSSWYPAIGQDRITVVMIDDDYLKWRKLTWPMPMNEHAGLLAKIQEAGAQSIFVDIIYATERGVSGSAAAFGDLVRDITKGHPAEGGQPAVAPVPVFLADIFGPSMTPRRCGDRDLPRGMVLPSLACAATAPVPVRWAADHTAYPAQMPAFGCGGTWPTPAIAQFTATDHAELPTCGHADHDLPPLFVVWGHAISARMAGRPGSEHCRYRQDNRTSLDLVEMVVRGLLLGIDRLVTGPERCFYTDTISASALFDTSPQGAELLHDFLAGRHVLVGTDMAGRQSRVVADPWRCAGRLSTRHGTR